MSLKAENITKIYGNQKALDAVSFTIKTGEIVGFLGPNGAGKSTMMKIITGFISQNSGDIFVNNLNTKSNIKEIKQQIGYLPEHNPLYLDMFVKEYLNFVAKLYSAENYKLRVSEIIEQTGLTSEQNKKIGALSKGFRQRTGLAAALIHNPEVLILDEPTTGLDPNQIIEIRNLIKDVGKEKTVMLSTHIMQEVEAICDRVIIINKGQIIADKPVAEINKLTRTKKQSVLTEFAEDINESIFEQLSETISFRKVKSKSFIFESDTDKDIRPEIFHFAVNQKLTILTLQQKEQNLEDIFRMLTQ
ncbi:MAG: gliding motility-associated ABC transporter ATP-binding subunit GldA [Bacteroidetes bacterium]|nr:MAG: gliding motility-associated ABC transporter ATP-binding subunit GldA [Bacteroidota bacterium]